MSSKSLASRIATFIVAVTLVACGALAQPSAAVGRTKGPEMVSIPGGTFEMGDHWGKGGEDPRHHTDEMPLHAVTLDAFQIGKYEVTNHQYCDALNYALSKGLIEVRKDLVYVKGGKAPLCETRPVDERNKTLSGRKTLPCRPRRELV